MDASLNISLPIYVLALKYRRAFKAAPAALLIPPVSMPPNSSFNGRLGIASVNKESIKLKVSKSLDRPFTALCVVVYKGTPPKKSNALCCASKKDSRFCDLYACTNISQLLLSLAQNIYTLVF